MSVYDKLQALNITLPPLAVPAAAYVPFVQTGNLVFLSGHIARKDGKVWAGQLGDGPDLDAGLVQRDQEVGQAPVAPRVRFGAGDDEAPLGLVGE